MAIKYNPYGWEIRPRETELQKTLEKEREIVRLEQNINFLMNEANTRINRFLSYDHDPIILLIKLDKIFPEVKKNIEEIFKLNSELYGLQGYPGNP